MLGLKLPWGSGFQPGWGPQAAGIFPLVFTLAKRLKTIALRICNLDGIYYF